MDAESDEMRLPAGKLRELSSGLWYVHCKWCTAEARLEALNEDAAYGMLHGWRLSMPRRKYHQRNWSCPQCAKWWPEKKQKEKDAAESAGQPVAKRINLRGNLRWQVEELKAEVIELKAEVDKWKDLGKKHLAYKAAHVMGNRKLRKEIDQLRAEVTAVPDDIP